MDPGHTVGFQQQVEAGEGGGTGQRVGGEGVAVEKGPAPVVAKKGLEDTFGRRGHAQRHGTAGEAFTKADDIRFLVELFPGEKAAGAAEAGE